MRDWLRDQYEALDTGTEKGQKGTGQEQGGGRALGCSRKTVRYHLKFRLSVLGMERRG